MFEFFGHANPSADNDNLGCVLLRLRRLANYTQAFFASFVDVLVELAGENGGEIVGVVR